MNPGPQPFRRKPLVFDAIRWDSYPETHATVLAWTKAIGQAIRFNTSNGDLYITIVDGGSVTAKPGDYIIRGADGEVYPLVPRRFNQLYEAEPK